MYAMFSAFRVTTKLSKVHTASNGITDRGLDAIIRHLLLPSSPPQSLLPTIQELILSNNDIALAGATPHLLSTALSHPSSSLLSLSMTSNPRIGEDPSSLQNFFKYLEPASLIQLQMNTCGLGPVDALSIARWLADPKKGGKISHLELNANGFGTDAEGTNRIAKMVYAGLNTSLLRLEMAANDRIVIDEIADHPALAMASLSVSPTSTRSNSPLDKSTDAAKEILRGDELPWIQIKPFLDEALTRNHLLREATRHAALQLLPRARILLHAKARSVTQQIEEHLTPTVYSSAQPVNATQTSKSPINYQYTPSPNRAAASTSKPSLLTLPPEIITHILRSLASIDGVPLPPRPSQASSYDPAQPRNAIIASPLSEMQFTRILGLARDRSTLLGMTHRFHDGNGHAQTKRDSRDQGRVSLHDAASFLAIVGCKEYDRGYG